MVGRIIIFFCLCPSFLIAQANCDNTSEGLTPLIDLTGTYKDSSGGLYGGGSNTIPTIHDSIGQVRALEVAPRNASGAVDWSGSGKIGVVLIGGSTMDRPGFFLLDTLAAQAMIDRVRPEIVVVNVGVPGTGNLSNISDTTHAYWTTHVTDSLSAKSVDRDQVQVAFLETIFNEPGVFATIVDNEASLLKTTARKMQNYFQNLKLLLVDSRPYGGYGPTSQEPTYYERGSFGHRAAILASIEQVTDMSPVKDANNNGVGNGMGEAAFMVWLGQTAFADGTTQRSDGLHWDCPDDFEDGIHLNVPGRRKQVGEWLEFLENNKIAKPWWLRSPRMDQ